MTACKQRDLLKVKSLIKSGVDPNEKTVDGITPLMFAAKYSKDTDNKTDGEQIVQYLLKKGADINTQQTSGTTALFVASTFTKTLSTENTVKILLDAGADPNTIYYSKSTSTENTVKTLIDRGVNLNMQNSVGDTALMYAIKSCLITIVKLLLQKGANPNILNVKNNDNNMSILTTLLSYNADLNLECNSNNNRYTALSLAVRNRNHNIVDIILKHKLDLLPVEVETLKQVCPIKYIDFIKEQFLKQYIKKTNSVKLVKFIPLRKAQIEWDPNSYKFKMLNCIKNSLYSLDYKIKDYFSINSDEKLDYFIKIY